MLQQCASNLFGAQSSTSLKPGFTVHSSCHRCACFSTERPEWSLCAHISCSSTRFEFTMTPPQEQTRCPSLHHGRIEAGWHSLYSILQGLVSEPWLEPCQESCTSDMVQDREGKDAEYAAPRLNLSIADFEFKRVLGEGSMSTVFHAVLKRTVGDDEMLQAGAECAMKVFDKFYIQRHKMTASVVRERHVMDKLHTDYTVRLKYTFQDAQKIYMALDLYFSGDLFEQLQLRKPLPTHEARFYAAEMVLILQCLRDHDVVFRDFKPENMLLTDSGHLVLTDFGCAKLVSNDAVSEQKADAPAEDQSNSSEALATDSGKRAVTFVGTADYLSPEVLKNTGCTHAVDLWAFGCVLFQLITGLPPFRDQSTYLTMQRIDDLKYEFPANFPSDARDLVSKVLQEEPDQRLGVSNLEDVKNHAFFTGKHMAGIVACGYLMYNHSMGQKLGTIMVFSKKGHYVLIGLAPSASCVYTLGRMKTRSGHAIVCTMAHHTGWIEWENLRTSKAPEFTKPSFKTMDADLWEMQALQEALPVE